MVPFTKVMQDYQALAPRLAWPSSQSWSVGEEYALLNTLCPVPPPGQPAFLTSHGTAASVEHENKNRYSDVLPLEVTRVRLEDSPSSSAYINASHVLPLDSTSTRFICAQAPLPNTFYDFWRMIFQEVRSSHQFPAAFRRAQLSPYCPASLPLYEKLYYLAHPDFAFHSQFGMSFLVLAWFVCIPPIHPGFSFRLSTLF